MHFTVLICLYTKDYFIADKYISTLLKHKLERFLFKKYEFHFKCVAITDDVKRQKKRQQQFF